MMKLMPIFEKFSVVVVPFPFTDQDALWLYERACGYNPSDPSTDQGGDEVTVMNFVQQNGLKSDGSHKIAGYIAVNGANKIEMQTDPHEVLR